MDASLVKKKKIEGLPNYQQVSGQRQDSGSACLCNKGLLILSMKCLLICPSRVEFGRAGAPFFLSPRLYHRGLTCGLMEILKTKLLYTDVIYTCKEVRFLVRHSSPKDITGKMFHNSFGLEMSKLLKQSLAIDPLKHKLHDGLNDFMQEAWP